MARVLVCEDNREIREILAELLVGIGLEVDCADNGEDALNLIKYTRSNLILSDIVMPKLSGTQLIAAIRHDPDLAVIPCILMSSPDWAEEALQAGCDLFIAKPFIVDGLRRSVRMLLGCRD